MMSLAQYDHVVEDVPPDGADHVPGAGGGSCALVVEPGSGTQSRLDLVFKFEK